MHDILYENQQELADVQQYALKIGLEIYRFESDMSGERFAKRVREDFRGGVRSGVNGTPTFFINDVRYNGQHTFDEMLAALENAAPA
jgi:protein-disulfide isomerase